MVVTQSGLDLGENSAAVYNFSPESQKEMTTRFWSLAPMSAAFGAVRFRKRYAAASHFSAQMDEAAKLNRAIYESPFPKVMASVVNARMGETGVVMRARDFQPFYQSSPEIAAEMDLSTSERQFLADKAAEDGFFDVRSDVYLALTPENFKKFSDSARLSEGSTFGEIKSGKYLNGLVDKTKEELEILGEDASEFNKLLSNLNRTLNQSGLTPEVTAANIAIAQGLIRNTAEDNAMTLLEVAKTLTVKTLSGGDVQIKKNKTTAAMVPETAGSPAELETETQIDTDADIEEKDEFVEDVADDSEALERQDYLADRRN